VACMPKSGSTFLTEAIANLPGMRRARLVPAHERREQEISTSRLDLEIQKSLVMREIWRSDRELLGGRPPRGFVGQLHLRYSQPTHDIIERYQLTPVVLVRNIFDVVVSLRDHIADTSPNMAMAYVTDEMRTWPPERMFAFIADMVIPWYLNFFVCWAQSDSHLLITYEEMTADPEGTLGRIADHAGMNVRPPACKAAVDVAGVDKTKTRFNQGVAGRGEQLPAEARARILESIAYYPDVDFSMIGIDARASGHGS